MGCLTGFINAIFSTTKAILIFIVVMIILCIGLIVIIRAGEKAATDKAIDELNNGRGTQDEPIARGTFMKFNHGQVRATRMIRPATTMVTDMFRVNQPPAAGADWVLVWFEVTCEKQECREFELDLQLVDNEGQEWSEPELFELALADKLDEAIQGATMSGWQAFEVSQSVSLELLKVKWGGVTLYQEIPPTSQ